MGRIIFGGGLLAFTALIIKGGVDNLAQGGPGYGPLDFLLIVAAGIGGIALIVSGIAARKRRAREAEQMRRLEAAAQNRGDAA